MLPQSTLLAILATLTLTSALPLNINLGAYSPALVVGDGEISFGNSPERASQVLQTLASGAQNGAVPPGTAAPAPAVAAPAPAAREATVPAPVLASPIVVDAQPAAPAAKEASAQPDQFISHAITTGISKYPNMAKKEKRSVNPVGAKLRRDLDGFREALAFARDAQKNAPKVELGFGITQNAGVSVPANSAANGALPPGEVRAEKRDVEERDDQKLGMTLIAISEI
ncbi:hypothetical protein EJ06DRAFT_153922 [Trichodelitschia bisporula]|uniref:Uncharacterized protein n=1 Tax=Trichodelitschia bisporula TaxID=703511 RepID=A0A6G1HN84_9PEZI|nr:hypothetical protein EJ06DRAFT_153922 [Trichodelitschia bisporula]